MKNLNIYDSDLLLVILYGVSFLAVVLIFTVPEKKERELFYKVGDRNLKNDYDPRGCRVVLVAIAVIFGVIILGIYKLLS